MFDLFLQQYCIKLRRILGQNFKKKENDGDFREPSFCCFDCHLCLGLMAGTKLDWDSDEYSYSRESRRMESGVHFDCGQPGKH